MQTHQLDLLVLSVCPALEVLDGGHSSHQRPSKPCTLQIKSSSQSTIFESQLPFTLTIFEAMKDWLRRNHPLYLIYKFKEFKVIYKSPNDIYLAYPLVNHFLITLKYRW